MTGISQWLAGGVFFLGAAGTIAAGPRTRYEGTGSLAPDSLRCEYRRNPTGLDADSPRLGWQLQALTSARNLRQTAYQVMVASSEEKLARDEADVWDSRKVNSDVTQQVTYAGPRLASRATCYWKVRAWDQNGGVSGWSPPAWWQMGLQHREDWQAHWIGSAEGAVKGGWVPPSRDKPKAAEPLPTPRYLRREFSAGGKITKAVLYVTALGLYEVRLNGRRVGRHLLAPEWTRYSKRVQVDAIDVTAMLKRGQNAIGAILGNGWYCGNFQFWPIRNRIFGDRPWFYAQLEIESDSGRTIIATDSSWQVSTNGPLRQSGIYEGESYDATKTMTGWDQPGFGAKGWVPAIVGDSIVQPGRLVWQRSEPIEISREIHAVLLKETAPGVYLYDLGQNVAGWARIRATAPAGTTVTMKYGEDTLPGGRLWRTALWREGGDLAAIDRYTFQGSGVETYEPHFTYHGFRYLEVSGLPHPGKNGVVTGCVFHTDMEQAGSFRSADTLLNRLAENIDRSEQANFMGIATDCPSRDERPGVTGDHQFFMPTAIYNRQVAAFFNKWLVDLDEDSQSDSGNFADIAPYYGVFPEYTQGWGDAGIICPYYQFQAYNDVREIKAFFPAMKRHLDFIERHSRDFIPYPVREGTPGDWLNRGGTAPADVMGTAYFAWMSGMMAEMAAAIGATEDAAHYTRLQQQIKSAFVTHFIASDGTLRKSSQSGYAMAFNMGLVPDSLKQRCAVKFKAEIARFADHPAVGFMGVPHLLPGLHKAGLDAEAYRLLLQQSFPSWLFMVKAGRATSIWERWDSWLPGKGFHDDMNSLNHVVWGSVGEYLFREIGGIAATGPGFRQLRIAPVMQPGLRWATTTYRSPQGQISTSWKTTAGGYLLDVTIPPNATAEIVLPLTSCSVVSENGKTLSAAGIESVSATTSAATLRVGSGTYRFRVARREGKAK